MIAIALGLVALVVMVATGVVVSSSESDRLTFLGVSAQTTTAQVFLTGAIFAWLFVIALWLLRLGMQRSGLRCAELAGRWVGLGAALGFGAKPGRGPGEGLAEGVGYGLGRSGALGYTALGSGGDGALYEEITGTEFYRTAGAGPAAGSGTDTGTALGRGVGGGRGIGTVFDSPGTRGDLGGSPGRVDSCADVAGGAVLGAATGDQTRALASSDGGGPGAGAESGGPVVGIGVGVNGGGQRGEISGVPRFVPGEHGGPHREGGERARRDQTG